MAILGKNIGYGAGNLAEGFRSSFFPMQQLKQQRAGMAAAQEENEAQRAFRQQQMERQESLAREGMAREDAARQREKMGYLNLLPGFSNADPMQQQRLSEQYTPETAKFLVSQSYKDKPKLASGVQEFVDVYGRKPTPQEWSSYLESKKQPAVQINTGAPSVGQKEFDKVAAKEFADYVALGGYADVSKNIEQLDNVVSEIESAIKDGKDLSGVTFGAIPTAMRPVVNPDATKTMEAVEEVVQRNLRLVLGAQFTQKEGERLIARAYNPWLDESINLERVKRLANSIKRMATAKQNAYEYFQKNGTLVGFKGPTEFGISDIVKSIDSSDGSLPKQGKLTEDMAMKILQEAGGDKEIARQLARDRGYTF